MGCAVVQFYTVGGRQQIGFSHITFIFEPIVAIFRFSLLASSSAARVRCPQFLEQIFPGRDGLASLTRPSFQKAQTAAKLLLHGA